MASDRCVHGLLPGMCSICLRREREIQAAMKRKKNSEQSAKKK